MQGQINLKQGDRIFFSSMVYTDENKFNEEIKTVTDVASGKTGGWVIKDNAGNNCLIPKPVVMAASSC